jgi:hypothetical protein
MAGALFRYRQISSARAVAKGAAGLLVLLSSACATAPTAPVAEKLDTDTATTLTAMAHPLELVAETPHGATSDPFAYLAPFETDRMGERALFLWVSAPQNNGAVPEPRVLCDGKPVSLQPVTGQLADIKLSRAPYEAPAPWSAQWYFRLPAESLDCLGAAQNVAVETQAPTGAERFSATGKTLAALQAFVHR